MVHKNKSSQRTVDNRENVFSKLWGVMSLLFLLNPISVIIVIVGDFGWCCGDELALRLVGEGVFMEGVLTISLAVSDAAAIPSLSLASIPLDCQMDKGYDDMFQKNR